MKKKELIDLIETAVYQGMKRALSELSDLPVNDKPKNNEIDESKVQTSLASMRQQLNKEYGVETPPSSGTGETTIGSILEETRKSMTTQDFKDLNISETAVGGEPLKAIENAIGRDYTELMKTLNKKRGASK